MFRVLPGFFISEMYLSTRSGLGRKILGHSGSNFGVKLLAVAWIELAKREELDLVVASAFPSKLFRARN